MNQTYSISDLSKEFGITTRTIRHYEEIGLISPNRRGQTRIYSPADRTRLKLILRGRRVGLSLEESREIIDMYAPGKDNRGQLVRLMERVVEQRERLEAQLEDIKAMLVEMNTVEEGCRKALNRLDKK